jgi:hypothetical protein
VRRVSRADVARMADLHRAGTRVGEIAARFGLSRSHSYRLLAAYVPVPGCQLAECSEPRPHGHCQACGLAIDPAPAPQLCALCEREALRAVMLALGNHRAAQALRTPMGDQALVRVLNFAGA